MRRGADRGTGYKYRFYPTPEQVEELARTFGCVRLVYNKALQERARAYRLEGRGVSYAESSAALTALKRSEEFPQEVAPVGGVHPFGVPLARRPAACTRGSPTAGGTSRTRSAHGLFARTNDA
ncbi:helix-turn-helix domain-containing protein [Nonomuraea sp. NPDC048916]|uniref:helix-turn-helix domain-containing protein n=1 Tax=Nonomuraea sp. NPDC048916 TaxID=3154232 RepID=UPI0033BFF7C9